MWRVGSHISTTHSYKVNNQADVIIYWKCWEKILNAGFQSSSVTIKNTTEIYSTQQLSKVGLFCCVNKQQQHSRVLILLPMFCMCRPVGFKVFNGSNWFEYHFFENLTQLWGYGIEINNIYKPSSHSNKWEAKSWFRSASRLNCQCHDQNLWREYQGCSTKKLITWNLWLNETNKKI